MSHNGNDISLRTNESLGDSLGTSDHKEKVKTKRAGSLWVDPLYGVQPNINFNKKNLIFWK